MKSLRTIPFLALVALMLVSGVAQAEPTVAIYVGDENWSDATIPKGRAVNLHVYLEGIDVSANAVEYKVNLPADMFVLSLSYPFTNAIMLGDGSVGYAIGFGQCVPSFQVSGSDGPLHVQTIEVYSLNYFPRAEISLSDYQYPANSTEDPIAPRYSDCQGNLYDLQTKSAFIATTAVDNDESSWGAVKSLY